MRVIKEKSSALIIDIQERLWQHIYEKNALAENTVKLIKGLNILQVPITVTQQYTKGLGPTVEIISRCLNDFNPVEKISFSCCDEPSFSKILSSYKNYDKKFIIIAGIETHVCVQQTVTDLLSTGFIPVVVEDCVSSRKGNDRNIAIERMKYEGAVIATCESILFELCRYAGNDMFKQISKIIK